MRGNSAEIAAGSDLIEEGRRLLERASASGTGILSYLVTLDTLIIWFGAPGSEVTVVQRPVARDSLAQLVGSFRAALGVAGAAGGALALRGGQPIEPGSARGALSGGIQARQASRRSVDSIADALGKLLLPANLDQRLGPAREIVIVPHGSLGLVPFGALPSDSVGTPLGSRYALRYTPSLAALAEAEARPALPTTATRIITLRKALVVGDPVMPTTASWGEAFELRPLHATEAEVRDRLPAAPLVHLATHGYAYASDTRARRSFVALAPTSTQDGFLTVGELLDDPQLTLSAELVVLSACQTGLGDLKQAEGTVGLQRALLARGARSALVSLWSVSDAATDLLMKRFYTHWLNDRDHPSKAEALRRAQEDVRARRQFRQPKYWAAFQLVGAR
jgi:CHAT domain-containing protein